MKIWQWFCQLCAPAPTKQNEGWQEHTLEKNTISDVEICTRLCGNTGCRCGGTIRGLHCIWSYYRK